MYFVIGKLNFDIKSRYKHDSVKFYPKSTYSLKYVPIFVVEPLWCLLNVI